MNEEELLQLYGLEPDDIHREPIRELLKQEIENRKSVRLYFIWKKWTGGRPMRSCFTLNSASRMILLIFPKRNGSQTINNITVFDICAHWKERYYAKFA